MIILCNGEMTRNLIQFVVKYKNINKCVGGYVCQFEKYFSFKASFHRSVLLEQKNKSLKSQIRHNSRKKSRKYGLKKVPWHKKTKLSALVIGKLWMFIMCVLKFVDKTLLTM